MAGLANQGTLAVVPEAALQARDAAAAQQKAAIAQSQQPQLNESDLSGFIRREFEQFRTHRNSQHGWNERMLVALRTFKGQYDAGTLAQIKQFGGSDIFVRLIAQKCRGASSLLRDVYLGADRPWGLRPPAAPDVPEDIAQYIATLIEMEAQQQQASPSDLQDRKRLLMEAAEEVACKRASDQADEAEDRIEELLRQGAFYTALAEFIVDLPIFPFAVIKGPVVKMYPEVEWPKDGGMPTVVQKPRLYWYRVNPFDFWFTSGVADIENANTIERQRITRAELNDMLDLPSYNTDNIRLILQQYGAGGLNDNWDTTDSERAVLENRENPAWNRSGLITMMEFNGNVQGTMLAEYGLTGLPDPDRDYHVQAWMIGSYVIKVQLSPNPRQRHPYFMTSFEKLPGTPVGNGLTDILTDFQMAANAAMRALLNNMAMASGPQVVVNDDRLSPNENGEELYPWKRWHVRTDPVNTNVAQKPIEFFQPQSNATELLTVYKELSAIADDISAIPKYVEGGNAGSGAGRTASGLAMLMGNASKILQTVSANVDRDVLEPALLQLFDLVLLTDTTGVLTGEEEVTVLGVNVAIQKETMRQRQVEFLGATQNPIDSKLMGLTGRAVVLRNVAKNLGIDGEEIVPNEAKVQKMQEQQEQAEQQNTGVQQAVDKAVTEGVGAGVKRITTELTSGMLASVEGMPFGAPTHIGTPGTPQQQQGGGMEQMGAAGQGMQPTQPSQGPPQTNTVTNAAPGQPAPGGS